jgi:GxxExxY protein
MDENTVAHMIIGAALEVHKQLGPGLLESTYQRCLEKELEYQGLFYESEAPIALQYRGEVITEAYRYDLLVENSVIVELKVVNEIKPLHKSQLLTYLRLAEKKLGLLMNFNTILLRNGICRVVNNL